MFQNLSSWVAFTASVDLNHCQQQGRKARRWKSIWHGVLLLQNEKKKRHNTHCKILQNNFHRMNWSPPEKILQLSKVSQADGVVRTQNVVKSHPIQWDIFPWDWERLYIQSQVLSWTCTQVLLAGVLTPEMWNGVGLTGVDESLSFSWQSLCFPQAGWL